MAITTPDLNPIESLSGRTEKACASKKDDKPDSLCQEEWAKIHPTYCGKLVEGYPKRLTQVKQSEGNATKY
jgi:hypothetical protein